MAERNKKYIKCQKCKRVRREESAVPACGDAGDGEGETEEASLLSEKWKKLSWS